MKQAFILTYVNGYGENGCVKFSANNAWEARTMAKNYCVRNMIKRARLITKSGKHYSI